MAAYMLRGLRVNFCWKNNAEKSFRNVLQTTTRHSHGPPKMIVHPSAWRTHTFRNDLHFYLWLGFIPSYLVWAYHNMFYGMAELQEIPEGYIPHEWEYYKHPMTRWWSKYINQTLQEHHERMLAYTETMGDALLIAKDTVKFRDLLNEHEDFIGYYYRPISNKIAQRVWEEDASPDAIARMKTSPSVAAPY